MIEPTVARVVHFWPADDDYELNRSHAPFAAIIADVKDGGYVNLTVFGKQGSAYARPNIPLAQAPLTGHPDFAFCTWMDYQRGQAAKSDELVAALTARIQSLEAAEANRVAAVKDVFLGHGQVTGGVTIAANGLETALTASDPRAI